MAGKKGSENIYATDTVRRAFDPALLDFLGEKTGKPLIIIGTKELDISDFRKMWLKHFSGLSEGQIAETTKNAIRDNIREYMRINHPDSAVADEFLENSAKAVQEETPAHSLSLEIQEDGYWSGGVILIELDMKKSDFASPVSGLPESALKNVPGTDAEWRALALMHEAGHVHATPLYMYASGNELATEIMADQAMVLFASDPFARGIIKTPGVAEAAMGMRAIGALDKYLDEDHATGPGVRTEEEATAFAGNFIEKPTIFSKSNFQYDLDHLRKKLATKIGDPLMTISDIGMAIKEALNDKGIAIPGNDQKIMEEAVAKIFSGNSYTKAQIEAMLAPLDSAGGGYHLDRAREKLTIAKGASAMESDPHLKYETVRRLYQDGSLDDTPIAKQYAKEFLEAAEKYAPDYFGVKNSPEPKPDPFKRLGAEAAPPAPSLTPKV